MLARPPRPARLPQPAPPSALYPYPLLPFIADACTTPYVPGMILSRSTSQKAKRCLDLPCRCGGSLVSRTRKGGGV
jgi:hypothetical protein